MEVEQKHIEVEQKHMEVEQKHIMVTGWYAASEREVRRVYMARLCRRVVRPLSGTTRKRKILVFVEF